MEDGGVLAGGEHHLWLEARLQEEASCRHCAASTVGWGVRTDVSVSSTQARCTPCGRNLLLALAANSHSPPPTHFLPLAHQANSLICPDSEEKEYLIIIIILQFPLFFLHLSLNDGMEMEIIIRKTCEQKFFFSLPTWKWRKATFQRPWLLLAGAIPDPDPITSDPGHQNIWSRWKK